METRPCDSTMHGHMGTQVQNNGSRCSERVSQHLKRLARLEDDLFANGFASNAIMSVCMQQWSMTEALCRFGCLLEKWSEFMVPSMPTNRGRYICITECYRGGVSVVPNLFCSRTMTPNTQAVRQQELSSAWRKTRRSGSDSVAPQSPHLNTFECLGNEEIEFKVICGWFSKVFGTTCQPSSFKMNWRCPESKEWSDQILIWFWSLFVHLKHFVNTWIFESILCFQHFIRFI